MRFCLLATVFSAACWSQQIPADLQKKINDQVQIEMTFRNPEPIFHKLVIERVQEPGEDGIAAFTLSVSGVSSSERYILMNWEVGTPAPQTLIDGVQLDAKGDLYCGKAQNCESDSKSGRMVVRAKGELGQPIHLVVAKTDKTPVALGEAFARPAIGTDKTCKIEAVWVAPAGTAVAIIGKGFSPERMIDYSSSSHEEKIAGRAKTDDRGEFFSGILPFVRGFDSGETAVTYKGDNCSPAVTFHWGGQPKPK